MRGAGIFTGGTAPYLQPQAEAMQGLHRLIYRLIVALINEYPFSGFGKYRRGQY